MIRIVDEPIFSMTRDQWNSLVTEYNAFDGDGYKDFEEWLSKFKKCPHTTHREENP